tara:strand:- start:1510 stop:2019 length:510 start_codon:yes stop_codon:yes gene_type:complete
LIIKYKDKIPVISKTCFIANSTNIIGDVRIGSETNIWFGTTIRADMHYIRIGKRTNIQDNSTIHVTTDIAPTIIGDGVTIGHGAIIHGCTIKDNCLIGMGSIIMDEVVINEGSMIAAGALIPPGSIVPKNTLMVGSPAKPIRKLRTIEKNEIFERAQHYIDLANDYRKK